MNRVVRIVSVFCLSALVTTAAAPAWAQAPAPAPTTASAFYMQYRKAFTAAQKIDDLLPYMSADTKKQVESTPVADRAQMFQMVKMMGELSNVKIVKETPSAAGATLAVTALDSDKKPTKGEITIVKEGAAFKLGRENWTN